MESADSGRIGSTALSLGTDPGLLREPVRSEWSSVGEVARRVELLTEEILNVEYGHPSASVRSRVRQNVFVS
jgi:hypothetical protein